MGGPPTQRRPVLSDHKRVGKRLIPPMLQLSGEFHDTPWLDVPLPELLWLGLLHQQQGFSVGSDTAIAFAKAAVTVSGGRPLFAGLSAYASLDRNQQRRLCRLADELGAATPVRTAIADLVYLYPSCPLAFVMTKDERDGWKHSEALSRFKAFLKPLFYRHNKEATHMAAASIGIALETGRMLAPAGMQITEWRRVAEYPDTDPAKRAGAGCRAAMNVLFSHDFLDPKSEWPRSFWTRGLQLEQCRFSTEAVG